MNNIYGNPDSAICIIRLLGEHEKEIIKEEINLISEMVDCDNWCMVTVPVTDWSYEMSPWEANLSDTEIAGSGAENKLNEIVHSIVSKNTKTNRKYVLAGYSLAGLFALWASYQTNAFDGIVACSPSVWYPDWDEYISKNVSKANTVYLSLGSKEHKTRNKLMATVKDAINAQYDRLKESQINVTLEFNPGNHYTDVAKRMSKGMEWVLKNM